MASPTDKKLRVTFLTNFVSPYRVPVLRCLAQRFDLSILVNVHTEFDRHWRTETDDLDVSVTRTWTRRRTVQHTTPVAYEEVLSQHIPTRLIRDLRRKRPDAIISGELGLRSMCAVVYGKLFGVPVILWSYHSRTSIHSGGLRRWIRCRLLGLSTRVVGMGTQAREVLRSLGVADEKIHDAWNTTDVGGHERRRATVEHAEGRARILRDYGKGRRIALVLGRLIPLKGIPELLDAWAQVPGAVRDEWTLVFVGSGPFEELVASKSDMGVQLHGHVKPEEVADWFSASDLHIFASLGDVWGLVVNESMLSGTATLCSIHAGCSDDLIEDDQNGLLFDPADPEACAQGLERALSHRDLPAMGRAAQRSAQECSVDRFAGGFISAVEAAVAPRASHAAATEPGAELPPRVAEIELDDPKGPRIQQSEENVVT